jgi:hypothetical protein
MLCGGLDMTTRLFDLNIEEVLENWLVEHALREVIANALDEQLLSDSSEIQISKDWHDKWHIRDFGRGLQIEHFTLNENQEKIQATGGVIGKFGVGLKDALATFYRRGIGVTIRSSYGTFTVKPAHKHGFEGIVTLHVEYDDTPTGITGTDFIFDGVTDEDMARAKSLFLKFVGEEVLDTTLYGQILRRQGNAGRIYILGVYAAEEPNFLFSYNITSLTDGMKKRLNRERLNVGRTTYADRVKAILKCAVSQAVQDALVEQVTRRATGDQADEMSWIEIGQMALNLMHQRTQVVMVTEQELQSRPDILDNVRSDGYQVVVISDQQKTRLDSQMTGGGPQVRTIENYVREFNDSFQYQFVAPDQLTAAERKVFGFSNAILALVGISGAKVPKIRISETMRVTNDNTGGVWDSQLGAIVIKRSRLVSLVTYASVLLHEVGHEDTGAVDATRFFEQVLTGYLGQTATAALNR